MLSMFVGHNAVGFASKRVAPRTSLGWLMAAPMLLDLLWPILLIAGVEHVRIKPGISAMNPMDFYDYPWSHSLATTLILGILFGGVYWLRTRYAAGAVTLFVGVVSHWLFDFVTHTPDLPLYPGGPKVGLGLWNSIAGTVVLELLLFGAGIAIYVRTTRARDRVGSIALWSLIAVLLLIYAGQFAGPPPQNASQIAWVTMLLWLIPFWAAWIDRHREARS
jgi:membrane-bound metal-dependent hydrolase YbcI (DUF457 family)